MWIAYFLNYCDRQVVFSLFPILRAELQFTDVQLGLTGSIFLWVYGLCSPIAGQLGDTFSKRLMVVLSLVLWSAVTVVTGASQTAVMLLACRAAIGISEALFMPSAISLTANAYPPSSRSRAVAILTTAQIAGIIGGGWFGGFMGDLGQWRSAFYVLGTIGILYALPFRACLAGFNENTAVETKPSGSWIAVRELIAIPTYGILCAVFATFTFGLWLIYGWLPNFFYEKFSFGLGQAAFTATIYLQGAALAGMLIGGFAADWLYPRHHAARFSIIAAGLVLAAPCLYFLGHSDSLALTKLAAVGFGLSSGLIMANIMASSFEVVPADTRASAVGFLNLFGAVISGVGVLMGGLWKQTIGIPNLMGYTGAAYFAAGILLLAAILTTFRRDYAKVH